MSNLTTCPDCGHQVSRLAKACPGCGRPLSGGAKQTFEEWEAEDKRKAARRSRANTQAALLVVMLVAGLLGLGGFALGMSMELAKGKALVYAGACCLPVAFVCLVILIGGLPGSIACDRGHPSADAISVCGWIGMFTFGVFWLVALIWAYTGPGQSRR